MQAERKDTDNAIRYLLGLSLHSKSDNGNFTPSKKTSSRLLRRVHRAEAERNRTNRMFKHLLKAFAQSSASKHAVHGKALAPTGHVRHPCTDLLGAAETSLEQEQFDGLFPVLEASYRTSESQNQEFSTSIETSLTSGSDGLSENSYIFHFAQPPDPTPSSSNCCEEIMLVVRHSSLL